MIKFSFGSCFALSMTREQTSLKLLDITTRLEKEMNLKREHLDLEQEIKNVKSREFKLEESPSPETRCKRDLF